MASSTTVVLQRHPARLSLRGVVADVLELSKVRLNAMVVVSTAVGFIVGSRGGVDWSALLLTALGTFLTAVGASAFNQTIEAPRDARMERTRNRPVPAGRISRRTAFLFGLWTSVIGIAILCPAANGLTALLALVNVLIYVLIYTPLKPLTSINTLVGAVVGALPPVMGWTAATGSIAPAGLVLGALLFVWQIPHFLALAWMYREDYRRGGYRMVSVTDATGRRTALFAILYSLALLPIGVVTWRAGATGWVFAIVGVGLGYWLFIRALIFGRDRTDAAARKLFLCSVMYLPLLLGAMVFDAKRPYEPRGVDTGKAYVQAEAVVPLGQTPAPVK